jgi:hypothetical protein
MLLLLGTATGILVVGAAAGARHRARHRWVSPYSDLASAMRVVTRTQTTEFRPSGLVALRPAPVLPDAEVVDFAAVREQRRELVGV